MLKEDGGCRALLDSQAMLLSSSSCMQKHRWKCFLHRLFANPHSVASRLKSSKKWLPAEEK